MALVCGLDLETTGLGVETDEIIEVGLVLWDTETNQPKAMQSMLVKTGKPVPEFITELTGISTDDLEDFGLPVARVLEVVQSYMRSANAVVAHNGELFDKPFLTSWGKRNGGWEMPTKPWIDTSSDLPYPEKIQTRKLVHLAAEHGFLNPFAHRAVFDVLTMLNVFSRYSYDTVLALSLEEKVQIQAVCAKPWEDAGESTNEAKANGFRWEGTKKLWLKTIRKSQLEHEQQRAKKYQVAIR